MNISDIVYETVSAYATVGLTRGITPDLNRFSQILIMATMIFGKSWPLINGGRLL